jgi:tRNA C32,U32 (ribose-2'-O)-methylase TrmJ
MLSTAARARLTVVLVGARNPSNIGAAARALQDFGFSDLRIVNDFAAPFEAAQLEAAQPEAHQPEVKSAVAAHHVMRSARRFDNLADAIADCSLIVATTAIGDREIKHPILPLQQAATLILNTLNTPGAPFMTASSSWVGSDEPRHPPTPGAPGPDSRTQEQPATHSKVALLFGSEKTGLTNDQLSHCSLLTTIPMFSPSAAAGDNTRHLSMNLGQSVAVCLYELIRSGFEASIELPAPHEAASTAQDRELLTQLLLDVLQATGYTRRFPANASEPLVRQLLQQLAAARADPLSHRQAMTWMGILRQILWRERNESVTPPNSRA